MEFDYDTAFSRNLGLVTQDEQAILRSKKVAIAGMGGVGGSHLLTLVRMGIERFAIADMDTFDLVNFNRQAGAMMSNLGLEKVEVMKKAALDINPNCKFEVYAEGVTLKNMDGFLDGVDIYVDGLDFFVLEMRAEIFKRCRELGIPAVTAGPIGLSTAYLAFDPHGMSFEDYFRLEGHDPLTQSIHFLAGLTPRFAQKTHIVDFSRINLREKRGASLAPSCMACSAVMGAEVLKILLGRGKVHYLPWALQFDMYQNKLYKTYNWAGNHNPLNKFKIAMIRKMLDRHAGTAPPVAPIYNSVIEEILDQAKWAPSGDNSQPWRIALADDFSFSVEVDRSKRNVYNLLEMPDLISAGMFLENAVIAARHKGYDIKHRVMGGRIEAGLVPSSTMTAARVDQSRILYPYIKTRSVNRYPYKLKPIPPLVAAAAEELLDHDIKIHWLKGMSEKWAVARATMMTSDIRLRLPETYFVHKHMIDWSGQNSPDKMPAASLGTNSLSTSLTKWALHSEKRNRLMLKLPAATLSFQVELDLIPSIFCASHFVMSFDPAVTPDPQSSDYIRAGANMQRFWLYLTSQNMALQPWYIPIMFSRYIEDNIAFTVDQKLHKQAQTLHDHVVNKVLGPIGVPLRSVFFTGRIGYPTKVSQARSVRKPLSDLINSDARETADQKFDQ
ncbi:MAG: ThiF family adenylyltransferase [Alphaproteobacteria bacterium]|nr:ThiF family adenylyltransferase [Alphaproteobacteria bacterium]